MSLYPELDGLPLSDLRTRLSGPLEDPDDVDGVYWQEIAMALLRYGEAGRSVLWEYAHDPDPRRVRAVLMALTFEPTPDPTITDLVLSSLHDSRPLVVAEALDGLAAMRHRGALGQIPTFLAHPSPFVRGAALRYLTRLVPRQAPKRLISALEDSAYIVRENAIDELAELGYRPARSAIREHLADAHPHVRQAARTALATLEGRPVTDAL